MAGLFLLFAAGFLLDPVATGGRFGLEAMSLTGMSALRGDLGGLFLACAALIVWSLLRHAYWGLLAVAVFMGCIALGRLLSLGADGYSQEGLTNLIAELAFVLLLALGYRRLSAERGHI